MTTPSDQPAAPSPMRAASVASPTARHIILVDYLWSRRDRFTEAALASAASVAGYTPEEIAAAAETVAKRRIDEAAARPVRTRARLVILALYGVTFLVFALLFLRPTERSAGEGQIYVFILAFTMGMALLVGLAWVAKRRPSADRAERALGVMLAVPLVLLVVVAGLCVATTAPILTAPGA